jgi:glycosyltransferase involved in cell wall biosynthesis
MNASFRYTVVGAKVFSTLTPPEQAVLPSLAKKYQLEGMGECLPFAGREEIRRILQSADVYVCTSLSETFGIAPREAMMCGVPVISTACGGVEEAITRNTGWQVATRNAGAIAEALLAMIKRELYFDPALVRKGITEQCGSEKFSYLMQEFYGLHTNQVA